MRLKDPECLHTVSCVKFSNVKNWQIILFLEVEKRRIGREQRNEKNRGAKKREEYGGGKDKRRIWREQGKRRIRGRKDKRRIGGAKK